MYLVVALSAFLDELQGKRADTFAEALLVRDSPENSIVATRCLRSPQRMTASANFIEIQRRAYSLPETEGASLAAGLLAFLPPELETVCQYYPANRILVEGLFEEGQP